MNKPFNLSIFCAASVLFSLNVNAQSNKQYNLIGQFEGLPNGTKVYLTTQEKDTIQTSVSDGDKFIFQGIQYPEGRFHFIRFDSSVYKKPSNAIFIENQTIYLYGKIGSPELTIIGSRSQNEYITLQGVFRKFETAINHQWNIANAKLAVLNRDVKVKDSIPTKIIEDENEEIAKIVNSYTADLQKETMEWLKDHENSPIAPYVMLTSFPGDKYLQVKEQLYKSLSSYAKNSYYGKKLSSSLENDRLSSNIRKGSIIPNIIVFDINGKENRLHDILKSNKVTLIDCWASWCSPCRMEVPKLKEIYSSYRNKGFGIIGVSSDKRKDQWLKAIGEDQTQWAHFLENKMNSITEVFGLNAIPAYILVDSNGKLIAFDCAMSSVSNFGGKLRQEQLIQTLNTVL